METVSSFQRRQITAGTYTWSHPTGSELRRISNSQGDFYKLDYSPDISPDSSRIVYATSKHGGNYEIETSDLKGDDRQRLTDNKWHDSYPIWSPDGDSVAFISHFGPPMVRGGVNVVDPDGINTRMIFQFLSNQPNKEWAYGVRRSMSMTWSPDGTALAGVWREGYLDGDRPGPRRTACDPR